MEFDAFQINGLGFPRSQATVFISLNQSLERYMDGRSYSSEVHRLGVVFAICEVERQTPMPKPRLAKAKTYKAADVPGFPKDWPDRYVPVSLEVKYYVDYQFAATANGAALRHAFVDPLCEALKKTPQTVQKKIDLARLIADLQGWADITDPDGP